MEKEIISSRQFMIITLLSSIGTAILISPASVTSEAKQDAWIAAIISVVLSLLIIKLFVTLGKRTPTLTFVEANEKILGRFFGKITSIGFIILSFLSAGELLYFIGIFMKTSVMPETPTMAFAFLFSIIIIYAAFLGIEVFARSAEVLFPMFILIFIFFVVCISPSVHMENLQPILETPAKSLFFSIIRLISIFSFPLVILLMIFPSTVNVHESAQKGFYIGTILGGVVLIAIITLAILVLSPTNTAARTFPSYSLAQRISIGNFLQRIEVIMAAMWIISIYIKTFMFFYAGVIGIAQICNINNHRPLIFPFGMIILGLSQIVHPSIIHSDIYNKETWPIFSFIFAILLPLVLLLVAKIRKINGNQENASQCLSSSNNENASQNASNSNSENASQSASSNNNENTTQCVTSSNNENASQNENSNGGNASQSESSSNNENASQSASSNNNENTTQCVTSSNNENTSQSASSTNKQNASQNASNSNNEITSQSASNSNSENASQSASSSNNENTSQNASSSNNENTSQSASSSNNENASQSANSINNENPTQCVTGSNNENASQNASNSNSENASQNASNSDSENASQSASSSNNENTSQNASSSNNENTIKSENATQNDSDTGNIPNSDKNKNSPEN
ncbi:endospore germination permease [Lysinibacillus sp. FJAT-14745]|uniref:endospore germination permease n=1 Tax=Lysinibacillus sp. FJAT-14745 TaxID=1704289 RepID=UPI0009E6C29D|nr:endospore germination permease [Lysinibacillus sp. FJAT-14745]